MLSPRLLRLLAGVSIGVGLLAGVRTAPAQQTYELGDDDAWVAGEAPEPGTPEAQLAEIRRALAGGQSRRAEYLASEWIERFPGHALLPEAYLLRGDALHAREEHYLALFDYELVARRYGGSEAFVRAVEREYEIAALFASGRKRKLWGMRIADAGDEAEELLIRVWERLPGSRLAERAGMTLADFYFARREMDLAAEMYTLFIENFPRSEQIGKARRRLIYAHLAAFKGPEFDVSRLHDARARLQELKLVDPRAAETVGADALLTRIDESDARKLLSSAEWYWRTQDYIAAEYAIRRLVRTHPRSVAAADALRAVPRLLAELPDHVRIEAPDYAALREALLGVDASGATIAPETPGGSEPAPRVPTALPAAPLAPAPTTGPRGERP